MFLREARGLNEAFYLNLCFLQHIPSSNLLFLAIYSLSPPFTKVDLFIYSLTSYQVIGCLGCLGNMVMDEQKIDTVLFLVEFRT